MRLQVCLLGVIFLTCTWVSAQCVAIMKQTLRPYKTFENVAFGDINHAIVGDQYVVFAAGSDLFRADKSLAPLSLVNPVKARNLGGSITSLSLFGETLVTASARDSDAAMLSIFRVNSGGQLTLLQQRIFRGSISDLAQFDQNIVFKQTLGNGKGQDNRILALKRFGDQWRVIRLASGSADTLMDLRFGSQGVIWHDGRQLKIVPDLTRPSDVFEILPPGLEAIRSMTARGSYIWLETDEGVWVFSNNGGVPETLGFYPNWYGLKQLNNRQVLVQDRLDPANSKYHVLFQGEDAPTISQLSLPLNKNLLALLPLDGDVLSIESNGSSHYQLICPEREYHYLLPYAESLELELNTAIDDEDLITLSLYGSSQQLLGVQSLSAQSLGKLNGSSIYSWPGSYNALETPETILLRSSRPMAPIISGFSEDGGRFAFRVPLLDSEPLYTPHTMTSGKNWKTRLYLKVLADYRKMDVLLKGSGDFKTEYSVDSAGIGIIELEPDLIGDASWLEVSGAQLGALLAGFAVFDDLGKGSAASPLISRFSDFLVTPALTDPNGVGFELFLANPNQRSTDVRALVYDEHGEIASDQVWRIPSSATYQAGLDGLVKDASWAAFSSDLPIMGLVLFQDKQGGQMGALPLSSRFGPKLVFAGVRENDQWSTKLELLNLDEGPASVEITAYDSFGKLVGQTTHLMASRGSKAISIADLFPEEDSISTVVVEGEHDLSGFLRRTHLAKKTWETFSALVE